MPCALWIKTESNGFKLLQGSFPPREAVESQSPEVFRNCLVNHLSRMI